MTRLPTKIDLAWLRRARGRILRWYDKNGRTLPWRESQDPYRIWVSEIMLQQTTVAAVVPYFERFLNCFPDVYALAAAPQDDVLKQWEGLGYYSRARNLHKAAGQIVEQHDGRFPETADELQQLPGIGPYTAGAIASFAFDQPAGIVEANTLRLYSRLMALTDDPRSTAGQKVLWKFANRIVPKRRPADFNQAVMDIGAEVCTPADPACVDCPLMPSCGAFEERLQHEIPQQKAKTEFTAVNEVSLAVVRKNRVLLRQYQDGERWAGLWDFVRFEVTADTIQQLGLTTSSRRSKRPPDKSPTLFDEPGLAVPSEIHGAVSDRTGITPNELCLETEIRHTVTRYKIRLLCLVTRDCSGSLLRSSGYHWTTFDELQDRPLSTTARQFADHLIQENASG